MVLDEKTWDAIAVVGPGPPKEMPWLWIGIAVSGVIAMVAGIALSRRKKK